MNPFWRLQDFGQSLWYDHLQRNMLGPNGSLARMISHDGLRGITTSLTDYYYAFANDHDYDLPLRTLLTDKPHYNSYDLLFELIAEDVREAADQLLQTHKATCGYDGYVSVELPVSLSHNSIEIFNQAVDLIERIDRPNVMIKIPATQEALTAITALTVAGININVSPIFCAERYIEVIQAYINGLRQRLNQGMPIDTINSVASFFVHDVENVANQRLFNNAQELGAELVKALQNNIAITNAKIAYKAYKLFFSKDFHDIAAACGRPMKLVWTHSTDLSEVESLIGPETITTLPPETYQAFKAEGQPNISLEQDLDQACKACDLLQSLNINLCEIAQQLEETYIQHSRQAFQSLLSLINDKTLSLKDQAA